MPIPNIIHKPKHVALISIFIALIAGIAGAFILGKAPSPAYVAASAGVISAPAEELTLSFLASGNVVSISASSGEEVKAGQTLAALDPENTAGALTQAKAAYASALANEQKLQNGATAADIAVSSAALSSAQTSLEHARETLVHVLADSLTDADAAVKNDTDLFFDNPEGSAGSVPTLSTAGVSFSNQALETKTQNDRSSLNAALSVWAADLAGVSTSSDLDALAAESSNDLQSAAGYLADLNSLLTTYTTAQAGTQTALGIASGAVVSAQNLIALRISSLTAAAQGVSTAETAVAQASAELSLKTAPARPEDIAAAQAQVANAEGAVEIALAAYDDRIIAAPQDGTVGAISITVGQTASPSVPAIAFSAKAVSKNVAVMIPLSAVVNRGGTKYVSVKTPSGPEDRRIETGISDGTNVEVLSGLMAGEEVAVY